MLQGAGQSLFAKRPSSVLKKRKHDQPRIFFSTTYSLLSSSFEKKNKKQIEKKKKCESPMWRAPPPTTIEGQLLGGTAGRGNRLLSSTLLAKSRVVAINTSTHSSSPNKRRHSREMRRPTRGREEDPKPASARLLGVAEEEIRRAVRGDNPRFVRDLELPEGARRVHGDLPVGARPHHETDEGLSHASL
jgi:hypothetical protein